MLWQQRVPPSPDLCSGCAGVNRCFVGEGMHEGNPAPPQAKACIGSDRIVDGLAPFPTIFDGDRETVRTGIVGAHADPSCRESGSRDRRIPPRSRVPHRWPGGDR